jgi:predicted amidohydrolase
MRVAGIQSDLAWEDPASNRAALLPRIEAAAAQGARLVALPEMWATGFSMRVEATSESIDGPSATFMGETAERLGVTLCGSVALRSGASPPRNAHLVASPDGTLARYDKIHTFGYGGESDRFDAGASAITLDVDGVRVTPLVCYDLRFPELFAALAQRTDLFVIVANWPDTRSAHWTALLTARAIECQCYVLGVNRIGAGGGLRYSGGTRLVDALGAELAAVDDGCVGAAIGDVDPLRVAELRATFGFLDDRRPDVYARLR